jgi:prepilin-type N-terminal cleavage/methylation domain-containing protein
MRLNSRPSRRAGFTLIELMTVIGIIALLVALIAGGIAKVRTGQQTAAAEQTVNKLQIALDQQWKAVLDQCKQDRVKKTQNFATLLSFCGGDADLAETLWAYMNLIREFPQTFAEATNPVKIPGVLSIPARNTFASVSGTSSGNATEQAAVLLYLNLSEKGNRGMGFNADDVTASAQSNLVIGGSNFRVFVDPWGGPITFLRFADYGAPPTSGGSPFELQATPFLNANAVSPDSLDPQAKLPKFMYNYNSMTNSWLINSNGTAIQSGLNANITLHPIFFPTSPVSGPSPPSASPPPLLRNKIITAISTGPNLNFEDDPLGNNATGNNSTGGTDDLFGYRLRKLGQKSN